MISIRPLLFLLLLSIPLFFLNIHNTHSEGGDDYAQYIKESQNIAQGKPYYQSNYVFNKYNNCYSPPQYPPGFPLLLAPVVRVYGIAIQPMCYFNTVLAVCLMLAIYVYFRKYTSVIAAMCLALVITYSGCMIDMKQSVLSDSSGMLFVLLYLITRNSETFSWRRIVLLVLFATMAMLIRTQAILLLLAEGIYLGIAMTKDRMSNIDFSSKSFFKEPAIYVIAGSMVLTFVLNKLVFYCPSSAGGFYVDFLTASLQKGLPGLIRDNASMLVDSITNFFYYRTDGGLRTVIVHIMESTGLVFCGLGFIISVTRRLCFDDIFFVLVCGLVLYYPIHDARYFLPVMVIVFYYCYKAMEQVIPVIVNVKLRYICFLLTFIYLFAGVWYFKSTTNNPKGFVPGTADRQAFDYIRTHVNDSDIIVCARPRLTTLYTNKRCMIHAWQYSMAVNKKVFDSMKVKYVLMNGIVDDYYITYLRQYQQPIDSVAIAPGYMLYTLR